MYIQLFLSLVLVTKLMTNVILNNPKNWTILNKILHSECTKPIENSLI